jgi:hypothetical protein
MPAWSTPATPTIHFAREPLRSRHQPLSAADAQLLWDGMAAATLISIDRHSELLRSVGFEIEGINDETDAWGAILAERLCMYQKLRSETEAAGTPSGHLTSMSPTSCSSAWCRRNSWAAQDSQH